ncbi:hypothetical protein ACJMK2_008147 [Sinanodonta woodiana]|uniref:Uncharacterized protein n=1 Tax=Sinanodonta woodiana TaxID=1069815 RepID=A0ABD3VKP4_SINWO
MDVMKDPQVVLQEIPSERKDGMYFITRNVRVLGQMWRLGQVCTTFIARNSTLLMINKRQCVYCVESNVKKSISRSHYNQNQ